jgi:hypothetical protein
VALEIAEAAGHDAPPTRPYAAIATPGRPGEPQDAEVVAAVPVCRNPWPYLVPETVEWYRQWLTRS